MYYQISVPRGGVDHGVIVHRVFRYLFQHQLKNFDQSKLLHEVDFPEELALRKSQSRALNTIFNLFFDINGGAIFEEFGPYILFERKKDRIFSTCVRC